MSLRAVSYGGGVQSTALLVLAAQGRIDFDTFLLANVGDDSEHPDTLRFVREVAMPYAETHDIAIHELHRIPRRGRHAGPCRGAGRCSTSALPYGGGRRWLHQCPVCTGSLMLEAEEAVLPAHQRIQTLWGQLMHPQSRSVPIPVRMSDTGAPGTRSCTADYKINVVGRWLKEHGATPERPATVALGISTDEIQRARPGTDDRMPYQFRTYPLLDLGLSRSDCRRLISDAGLPVPPKSACFFCPFHDVEAWRKLKRDTPDLFARAVTLEDTLNERREVLGKDRVYLTRAGRRIAEVFADDQMQLDGLGDDCDSGWCFT